jgi:uncharacterized membrane protein YhaH (DUF805 family)
LTLVREAAKLPPQSCGFWEGTMDWQNLFLTNTGRLDRQPFWIGLIVLLLISLALRVILVLLFGHHSTLGHLLYVLLDLPLLYAWVNIGIKRFHDRNKSGWWVLIVLIPLIGGIWYLIECGFLPGTDGPNRFDPT